MWRGVEAIRLGAPLAVTAAPRERDHPSQTAKHQCEEKMGGRERCACHDEPRNGLTAATDEDGMHGRGDTVTLRAT